MTAEEFTAARLALGLTVEQLAPLLHRKTRQLYHWQKGSTPVPHWVQPALAAIRAEAGKLKKTRRRGPASPPDKVLAVKLP
jgi:DNA-binding transcriptional regulator YiaG